MCILVPTGSWNHSPSDAQGQLYAWYLNWCPPSCLWLSSFKNLFILLFLVALGLHCCMQAFSGCRELGLLSSCNAQASQGSVFPYCGTLTLGTQVSVVGARGISPDQGWNPCPLHRQGDSYALYHQGSPFLWLSNFSKSAHIPWNFYPMICRPLLQPAFLDFQREQEGRQETGFCINFREWL